MNENIGSKGKGNDYRRVLKNIARKKKLLQEQNKKNRPKRKRVIQIVDPKKKRQVVSVSQSTPKIVENGTKMVLKDSKSRKKKGYKTDLKSDFTDLFQYLVK